MYSRGSSSEIIRKWKSKDLFQGRSETIMNKFLGSRTQTSTNYHLLRTNMLSVLDLDTMIYVPVSVRLDRIKGRTHMILQSVKFYHGHLCSKKKIGVLTKISI